MKTEPRPNYRKMLAERLRWLAGDVGEEEAYRIFAEILKANPNRQRKTIIRIFDKQYPGYKE